VLHGIPERAQVDQRNRNRRSRGKKWAETQGQLLATRR